MALRYKIKAAGRKYKDQNGNEKTQYLDIGAIMDGRDGGFVMKLEVIPTGWDGFGFLAEPEARPPRNNSAPRRPAAPAKTDPDDSLDDIPF